LSVAGYETTGEWLAWTLFLLARHPEALARLQSEVDRVLGDRAAVAADQSELGYTESVLAESLRLYPPTWIFVRVACDDDVLPSGAAVRAGTKVYLCQWVVHRLARHFPDPARFDPERFTPEARAARPAQAYFPFGAGPRTCIGESLAQMEAVLALATIARSWCFELVAGQKIVPHPGVTLRPRDGIRVKVRRRTAGTTAVRGAADAASHPGDELPTR
jgi:cytochrome P450